MSHEFVLVAIEIASKKFGQKVHARQSPAPASATWLQRTQTQRPKTWKRNLKALASTISSPPRLSNPNSSAHLLKRQSTKPPNRFTMIHPWQDFYLLLQLPRKKGVLRIGLKS